MIPKVFNSVAGSLEELLQRCELRILVPINPLEQSLDTKNKFENLNLDIDDLLSRIPQRKYLLIGE